MQSELQDLRSVFKLHFEQGGELISAQTGETLVYQSRQSFGYDFMQIKDILEEVGALEKAVKLNTGFIDRLVGGLSLDEEKRNTIKNARQETSETRNIQVIKSIEDSSIKKGEKGSNMVLKNLFAFFKELTD